MHEGLQRLSPAKCATRCLEGHQLALEGQPLVVPGCDAIGQRGAQKILATLVRWGAIKANDPSKVNAPAEVTAFGKKILADVRERQPIPHGKAGPYWRRLRWCSCDRCSQRRWARAPSW
jgi:hypothetical protein